MFDFSFLNNIDFSNKKTIVFLAIALFLIIVVLALIIIILYEVIKIVERIFIRLFGITKENKKDLKKNDQPIMASEINSAENIKLVPKVTVEGQYSKDNEPKIFEAIDKNVAQNTNTIMQPMVPVAGASPKIVNIKDNTINKGKSNDKDANKSFEEKEQKDIQEGLSKLKSNNMTNKDRLGSMMPSRSPQEAEGVYEKIKIATKKNFRKIDETKERLSKDNSIVSSDVHETILVPSKETREKYISRLNEEPKKDAWGGIKIERSGNKNVQQEDQSIFEGKSEVPRSEIKRELESRVDIWKAAEEQGLNMTPIERGKLVRKIFSPRLGENISRQDFDTALDDLKSKMRTTQDQSAHAKIRKEIDFLKKIGGVK